MLDLKVFLSSPGDVAEERAIALQIIERLSYDPLLRGRVKLEAVAWDKPGGGAPLLATMTPQQAVNEGLPTPGECDIVVVIFWSRMGTPLPPDYTKADGSRYQSGTEWEYEDAIAANRANNGRPDVVVYRRSEQVLLDPAAADFADKLAQWQAVQGFFADFSAPDGSISRGYNAYDTPGDFGNLLNHHLKALIQRRLDAEGETHTDLRITRRVWTGSPFPGLRAFTAKEAPIFFGREREISEVVGRLRGGKMVAVVGASGSGKSSLVAAGVMPRLRMNAIPGSRYWRVQPFTPGDDAFQNLRAALQLEGWTPDQDLMAALEAEGEESAQLLLVLDQFEELFTLHEPHRAAAFITWLCGEHERMQILLTVRADFYAQCIEHPALATALQGATYPLGAPGTGLLYEMMVRPAELAMISFEEGLVNRILADMGSDPGALALLAYTLDELYRKAVETRLMTHADYEALGGVQGAIGQRAQDTFNALDDDAKAALPAVFRELVTVNDEGLATRRRADLAAVTAEASAAKLVEALTQARLLVKSQTHHHAVVEIAHEALLRSWPALHTWLEEMNDDLRLLRQMRHAVRLWEERERSEDWLWAGEQLLDAQQMVQRLRLSLSPSESEFLRPEQERLLSEIALRTTSHYRRVQIGERLSLIGDSRPGVGLRGDALPDILWCDIPGGEVRLSAERSPDVDPEALHQAVSPFRIAKYPVTVAQYQAFVEADDGWQDPRWWRDIGGHRSAPSQPRSYANHPVENVSWNDATAFCRWLSHHLGMAVRLPTEFEWQQAATGGDPLRVYPWGEKWEAMAANTRESELLRATAVGMYPQGASVHGVMDMVGNVWEWCQNALADPRWVASQQKSTYRALRGCSHQSRSRKAIIGYRAGNQPGSRSEGHGFRVAVNVD